MKHAFARRCKRHCPEARGQLRAALEQAQFTVCMMPVM